ncbi:hypothetical protein GUJ93_ZPchr0002g24636 [Zizania palustris]|uniref:Uncharacterized protein n=1 Tax=Zizania palustris TaxID=103762 RepID=A0A8J5VG53_ZIZPA|nr:hypothetical protein GUJ93_ZPchr0002g24636 [Zizania palustris]
MAAAAAAAVEVERLNELGDLLSSAKDKSQARHRSSLAAPFAATVFDSGVFARGAACLRSRSSTRRADGQSVKAKHLAAHLIPRFFRSFPALVTPTRAMEAMFDLVDMEELAEARERIKVSFVITVCHREVRLFCKISSH